MPRSWTSTLLGLLGLEDETLFPRARPALLEGEAEAGGSSEGGAEAGGSSEGGGEGGGAASAALLFLPSDKRYKQVLDEIHHPSRWADAAPGVLRGLGREMCNASTWPVDEATAAPLAVRALTLTPNPSPLTLAPNP